MSLQIRLLGKPRLDRSGEPRPLAGQKTWGLLALLLLRSSPPTRRELLDLLWPEPADPGAALRWTLSRVRSAIAPEMRIRNDPYDRLVIQSAADVVVDALVLLGGSFDPAMVDDQTSGELLEGFAFPDAPLFEQWLSIERAHVASAARDGLRWAAAMLADTDPLQALRHLSRLASLDPFDDRTHELAIEIRVGQGDRLGAIAYLEGVDRVYRRELGIAAPTQLGRPLERSIAVPQNPLVNLEVSAAALIDAARARYEAGDYEAAIDGARRASVDAAASGQERLDAEASLLLATILIHSVRGRDREAASLLGRALRLAHKLGANLLASEIERESGYVAFLEADYGAAEACLLRAVTLADVEGDDRLAGRALTILGASRSDRGDHAGALVGLSEALDRLERSGDARWHAYASTFLARLHLVMGSTNEATATARAAAQEAQESGWHSLVPFPIIVLADTALAAGDPEAAVALGGQAYTLATEMADPCWEALSLRVLARCEIAEGHPDEGQRLLAAACERSALFPDTYKWAVALVLTELAEAEGGLNRDRIVDAREIADRGPIPDLIARLNRLQGSWSAQHLGGLPDRHHAGAGSASSSRMTASDPS